MSELWSFFAAILVGFIGLVWSADRFVGGSAAIAKNLGVSKLIIGLTIVSLGTSAPEIVVSISAALKGAGELAVGNALGSNLANIGIVLAITGLISRLPIQKHLLTQEIPVLILVTIAAGAVLWDATISLTEGLLLAGSILPLIGWMIYSKRKHASPKEISEEEDIPEMPMTNAAFWFVVGLGTLIGSSEVLVWGAKNTAEYYGVSPLIVGLTIIAVGTSLPELAASVMSALKGHHDIALGNIIGSNVFNILAVMSIPGLTNPPAMENEVFNRDFMAMAAITALLCGAIVIDYWIRRPKDGSAHQGAQLGRVIASLLLATYCGYYVLLFGNP